MGSAGACVMARSLFCQMALSQFCSSVRWRALVCSRRNFLQVVCASRRLCGRCCPGPVEPFAPGLLGAKGSLYVTRQTLFTHMASRASTQAMADALFAVVLSGQVKIHIAQRYALADVQQAHRDLEARKTTGSTILTL